MQVPGLTIMRDVAISKKEFNPDEQAITKIQDYLVHSNKAIILLSNLFLV